ncbi:MAG: VWA domain-containing protein [Anaerolineae bacterium]|nr:VWA domain-containing protein [Anaerolineae bacterium]
MEERIGRFIAALRASGVRVSVAESQDAWRAVEDLGARQREAFRLALRTTLIKDEPNIERFEELFPMYFGTGAPPLMDPQAELSPDEQQMLQQAMQSLAEQLQQLMEWLLSGQGPSQDELEELADQAGMNRARRPSPLQQAWYERRMQRLLGWQQLQELLEMLWEMLAQMGMDPQTIEQLQARVAENQAALEQQLSEFAGQKLVDNMIDDYQQRPPIDELMERPFGSLTQAEMDQLRDQVRRLAARLRSRAALRQKRGKRGKLDSKTTIRANLRHSGVPFEMHFKQKRLKPKVVAILDVSTSMRPLAEFFVRLLYELQDQIQKTRSFAFIDHLEDVTDDLLARHIDDAVHIILHKLPPGHYNTDLGHSLRQFEAAHLDAVDRRTTVIVVGDGRNNYNDPAIPIFSKICRRARRAIWLNPEYPAQWGSGDSDMLQYAPLCTEIYQVRNLAQLADAIDRMLAG